MTRYRKLFTEIGIPFGREFADAATFCHLATGIASAVRRAARAMPGIEPSGAISSSPVVKAAMESLFASLKTERLARTTRRTQDQVRVDVFG